MSVLDRDTLIGRAKPTYETVAIGPLGGEVVIRRLPISERMAVEQQWPPNGNDAAQMRYALALTVRSLCNEDRTPMFDAENTAAHIEALMESVPEPVQELMAACLKVQGLGGDQLKDAVGN